MIVKIIEDKEVGKKWEIIKNSDNNYSYKYYEFFTSIGWRLMFNETDNYSKDTIEWEFDINIA